MKTTTFLSTLLIIVVLSGCFPYKEHYSARNALYEAIDIQNMDDIQNIVERSEIDLNPNLKANQVNRPLSYAAMHGNDEIMAYLISQGAELEGEVKFSNTALILAAQEGRDDSVIFLVKNGANVNHVNDFGLTAMHIYAQRCDTNMLDLLIARGADLNAQNEIKVSNQEGEIAPSVLQTAIANQQTECVSFLQSKGAK